MYDLGDQKFSKLLNEALFNRLTDFNWTESKVMFKYFHKIWYNYYNTLCTETMRVTITLFIPTAQNTRVTQLCVAESVPVSPMLEGTKHSEIFYNYQQWKENELNALVYVFQLWSY